MDVLKFKRPGAITPMDVNEAMKEVIEESEGLETVAVIFLHKGGRLGVAYSDCQDSDLHLMGSVLSDYAMTSMRD